MRSGQDLPEGQMAFLRLLTDSNGGAPGKLESKMSRRGGWPKKRLHS
jgi:hypothetical protein